jgi:hypothetical protein
MSSRYSRFLRRHCQISQFNTTHAHAIFGLSSHFMQLPPSFTEIYLPPKQVPVALKSSKNHWHKHGLSG